MTAYRCIGEGECPPFARTHSVRCAKANDVEHVVYPTVTVLEADLAAAREAFGRTLAESIRRGTRIAELEAALRAITVEAGAYAGVNGPIPHRLYLAIEAAREALR